MTFPERSAERDTAIEQLLPYVAARGWNMAALTEIAGADADLLFPGGPADLVEAYTDLADRWMKQDAAATSLSGFRLPERVRAVIAMRLERNAPYKEAVRRGLSVLAHPGNGLLAGRCTVRTVDAIWYAAGDQSADFSWYTKRVILAGVYGSTLLYWLRDPSEGGARTLGFLDRRLSAVGRIGRARRRVEGMFARG